MGIWIELGVFVLALAFGLWQIHDVKKAREWTQRQKAQALREAQARQASEGAAETETADAGSAVQKDRAGSGP